MILNENGSLQRDTGGNARGTGAVDLQIARSAATEIAASVYSALTGGQNNSIASTADYATIGEGRLNGIRTQSDYSTIGGGHGNYYEAQERLFEAQEKELKALLIKVQALQGQETNR